MHNFPHGYASGWYQIGWSGEFEPGDVVPLHYFDTHLVGYRNNSGVMHLSDAFCPHMGGHLGYGHGAESPERSGWTAKAGKVEGDCLVCPFHGWKWDGDGRNVDIPYSEPERMNLQIRQWEVREIDGLVLMWYGAQGEPPTWEMPHLLSEDIDLETDYWPIFPDTARLWKDMKFPPQVATENSGDAAHFQYVHGAAGVPEVQDWECRGHWFRTSYKATWGGHAATTWATPKGPVDGTITTECHGMGLAAGHIESFDEVRTLAATTPVDKNTSDHRATVWVPRVRGDGSPLDEKVRDRWARQQFSQHVADFPVWENMTYIAKPPFAATEVRSFRALRQWIETQYTPSAAAE